MLRLDRVVTGIAAGPIVNRNGATIGGSATYAPQASAAIGAVVGIRFMTSPPLIITISIEEAAVRHLTQVKVPTKGSVIAELACADICDFQMCFRKLQLARRKYLPHEQQEIELAECFKCAVST